MSGTFVHTLVLTDVASGWTECAALVVRESGLVVAALEQLEPRLPIPVLGLDTDNGSEFLNEVLLRYCDRRGIALTRSRPYRKNDQAWVEQKNGAVVRRMVGYRRFAGLPAARTLSRLYAALRLFVNFFQPSFKLLEKTRVGARVSKRYSPPETPCGRLLALDSVSAGTKEQLRAIAAGLDPLMLLDEIRRAQQDLASLGTGDVVKDLAGSDMNLDRFLQSLASAWRDGEVRPTHRREPGPGRHWRTRKDPFDTVWPRVEGWLEADPDQTGKQVFQRLQAEAPGAFDDGQLRTLQRRVKAWRQAAARELVLANSGFSDVAAFRRE